MPIDRKDQLEAAAATRLALIRRGKRQWKDTIWPGTVCKHHGRGPCPTGCPTPVLRIKLGVLSNTEVQECYAAAHHRFVNELKVPIDVYSLQVFQDEIVNQILFRGCRDADDPSKPFAESVDDLRDNTTVDERAAAFIEYRDFQQAIDPSPEELGAELLGEIIDAVKKKDGARLRDFGSSILAAFILTTVDPPSS